MRYRAKFIIYQVSFLSEFKWSLDIFLDFSYFSLISISMNLFDQLVIVICNPFMKGGDPSGKEFVVLVFIYSFKMMLWEGKLN